MKSTSTLATLLAVVVSSLASTPVWSQAESISRSGVIEEQGAARPLPPAAPNATLVEGFEGAFPPAGWIVRNQSTTIGTNTNCWNQFTGGTPWVAQAGTGHAGANFNCTTGANTISGWLITSQITGLANGDQVTFWTRKASPDSFPDRLELRLCLDTTPDSCGLAGSTGATSTDVGSFTTVVLTVNPTLVTGVYPTTYTQFSATLSGLPAGPNNGRLAFRYFVTNGGPSGSSSDLISIDSVSVATPATADLSISKTDGAISVNAGTSTVYTVAASNAGPSAATGTVADTFPAACSGVTWTCAAAGGGTCTASGSGNINQNVTLPVGASVTFTATCPVSIAATGSLANTATITAAAGITDPTPGNNSATDTDTIVAATPTFTEYFDAATAPALPVLWTATNPVPGNGILWTTTSTGTPAADTAPNAAIIDNQAGVSDKVLDSRLITVTGTPAFLSFQRAHVYENNFDGMVLEISVNGGAFADAIVAGGSFVSGGYTNTISSSFSNPLAGQMAWAGPQVAFSFRPIYALPGTLVASDQVRFRWRMGTDSSISATGGQIDTVNGYGLVPTPVADLAVTLTDSPDPVNAGANISYTATATNNGPDGADAVAINLSLPAGTGFVSATPSAGGSCNATSPVVCSWAGATALAAARSVVVVASVPSNTASGTVLNATAAVSSMTLDSDPANDSAATTTSVSVSADLSVALTDSPDPVTAGTNLTYTATVNNAGPSDASGVTVTLPVPANTTFVSGTTTGGGSCTGAPIVCTFPTNIAASTSQSATITVAVSASAPDGSSISATASVATASTDPNGANNSASASTLVAANANLLMSLSASALAVSTNEPVSFTATSLNQGPSDAQNLSITMTLTPDFRYSAHTATGATCTTPQVGTTGAITCTWAGATAPGVTRTLVVVAYSNNEGATAVNSSTVSDTSDPVTTNNNGNVSVQVGFPVVGVPALDQYGLILLGLMLGLLGFVAVRRNS
ncbi:MAG: IPTL-CTERM sorting domain-containing protein [Lysobacterales bacterium]